jgi:hypothetical protein
VELAAEAGLSTIALTDHDTLAGLPEAAARAAELGVELISGVEVTCSLPSGGERHVLAYGVDPTDEALATGLAVNGTSRRARVDRMVAVLAGMGVAVSVDAVLAEARGASVGRPHVADALVRAGHARSRQEAFDRWLGDGMPAAVPKTSLGMREAIDLIHGAGGLAVLAHPGRRADLSRLDAFAALGLDGIEVTHPSHAADDVKMLQAAAARLGLLTTGGSDNHGDAEGLAAMRARRVPRHVADELRKRLAHGAACGRGSRG